MIVWMGIGLYMSGMCVRVTNNMADSENGRKLEIVSNFIVLGFMKFYQVFFGFLLDFGVRWCHWRLVPWNKSLLLGPPSSHVKNYVILWKSTTFFGFLLDFGVAWGEWMSVPCNKSLPLPMSRTVSFCGNHFFAFLLDFDVAWGEWMWVPWNKSLPHSLTPNYI